jgi:hypothetical protein
MPTCSMASADLFRGKVEVDAEGGEDVSGAALRGGGAVAMLGNLASRTRNHEGRSSGDVERVRTVAACADDVVYGLSCIEFDFDTNIAHRTNRASDLRNGLALHAEGGEIRTDLRGRGLTRHDDGHRFFGFLLGEVCPVDGFGDKWFEHNWFSFRGGSGFQIEEVLEQLLAVFGEDGFGMELHTIGVMFFVLKSHDLFFGCDGCYFELGGDGIVDDQRVIAHRFERRGDVFEDSFAVMCHFGCLAVHETLGTVHFAAEDRSEGLMSETDAEYGNLSIEVFDGIRGDAVVLDGFAWTR